MDTTNACIMKFTRIYLSWSSFIKLVMWWAYSSNLCWRLFLVIGVRAIHVFVYSLLIGRSIGNVSVSLYLEVFRYKRMFGELNHETFSGGGLVTSNFHNPFRHREVNSLVIGRGCCLQFVNPQSTKDGVVRWSLIHDKKLLMHNYRSNLYLQDNGSLWKGVHVVETTYTKLTRKEVMVSNLKLIP